ncbi:MAG TPA: histidine phosphotransferase family protein [Magnetospirillaceae bacterium]|jgi:histidine phosphotransferase ChpT
MADDDLILAELLCARLVHDLSGPVGAVANGAELLEDAEPGTPGGDIVGEAVELLSVSAAAAVARLRFLRLALGPHTGSQSPSELRRLSQDYFTKGATGGEAITLDWPTALDAGLAALPGRLILNALMLGRDCLPRGGTLRMITPAAGTILSLVAEGTNAAPAEAAKALAATDASGLTARGAQGYFVARLAGQAGLRIAVTPQPGRVAITLNKG